MSQSPPYDKKLYSLIKRNKWKDAFNYLDPNNYFEDKTWQF